MSAETTRFTVRAILVAGISVFTTVPCAAQNIRVRAISLKDGRPLSERRVQLVCGHKPAPNANDAGVVFNKWAFTDGDGIATFDTDGLIPPHGSLFVGGIAPDRCSPPFYSSDEVLEKGVSIARGCPHRDIKKFLIPPKPGEIIVYFAEYTRWERMLYLPWPD